jgi:hypothetical protein
MAKKYPIVNPWRPTLTCPSGWEGRIKGVAERRGEALADALRRYAYNGMRNDEREEDGMPVSQSLRVVVGDVLDQVAQETRDGAYKTAVELNRGADGNGADEAREARNQHIDQIIDAIVRRIEDATR